MKRLAKLGMCVAVMGVLVFAPFTTAGVPMAACLTERHAGTLLGVGGAIVTMHEKPTGAERAFRVAESASVRRDGKLAKLADLRPGDVVIVVTETDARKVFATVVDARTPRLQTLPPDQPSGTPIGTPNVGVSPATN